MRSQIGLGRVFGIKIGLHYSWLLIAPLIAFSLANQFRATHAQGPPALIAVLATLSAVLFFVCLLLHEFSHSLVAKAQGMRVSEVTLFALGGVSQIVGEARSASAEFWIAFVGSLTSALLGSLFLGIAHVGHMGTPFQAVASNLGYINIGLAFFNLTPAYPMDGGRILRAILWWKDRDMHRATHDALRISQAIAIFFILIGAGDYFFARGIGGLWIAFIGWFLLQAARDTQLELGFRRAITGITVGDLMLRDFAMVDGQETIQSFVDNTILHTGRRSYLVSDDGKILGLVTPSEIKHVTRSDWANTPLRRVMRPLSDMVSVSPDTPLLTAIQTMSEADVAQLPVMSASGVRGVLSREQVLEYLQTLMELKIRQQPSSSDHRTQDAVKVHA